MGEEILELDDSQAICRPPTSVLPSMKQISCTPLSVLEGAVRWLRQIYTPEVRGAWSKVDSSAHIRGALDDIRHDEFERAYAIRWLISLVSAGERLIGEDRSSEDKDAIESLVDDAASLLAACAGTASSGVVTREYRFSVATSPTSDEDGLRTALSISLTDVPFENGDYSSVGAQTWGAAIVLSRLMLEDPGPSAFGIPVTNRARQRFRVLELGAGTGLVGLAIAKLLALHRISAEVILTDFYPVVLENLRRNVAANFSGTTDRDQSLNVSVHRLDWSEYASNDDTTLGVFDLIVGADIIYEANHAEWIRLCLFKLIGCSESRQTLFHLLVPLRKTHDAESRTIEDVYGGARNAKSDGRVGSLTILESDTISRSAFSGGRGEEDVHYAYYKIGLKTS